MGEPLQSQGFPPKSAGLRPFDLFPSWHPVCFFFAGQTPVFGRICPYGHVFFPGHLRKSLV